MRLAFLLCLLAGPVAAEWAFVEGWKEPLDGYQTNAAVRKSADGVTWYLYRNPVGRVMALYALPEGDVAGDGVVARLTPQGFDTKDIEARAVPGRVVEYARSAGPMLRDRLWHGEGQVPVGTLADILAAPSVTLEVTLTSGEVLSTTWDMQGAGLPLARALGLNLEGVPAGAAWEDTAAQSMLAAMTACQFPQLDMACVQRVTACSDRISEARDIEAFEGCVTRDE